MSWIGASGGGATWRFLQRAWVSSLWKSQFPSERKPVKDPCSQWRALVMLLGL